MIIIAVCLSVSFCEGVNRCQPTTVDMGKGQGVTLYKISNVGVDSDLDVDYG